MGFNIAGLVIADNYDKDIEKLEDALGWNLKIEEEITFERASKNWTPNGEINVYFSDKGTMIFFSHEMAINGYHPEGVDSLCYAYSATAMMFLFDYMDKKGNHRSFVEENHDKRTMVTGIPIALEEKHPTADGLIFAMFDELLQTSFHQLDFGDTAFRCVKLPYAKRQKATESKQEQSTRQKQTKTKYEAIDDTSRHIKILLGLTLEELYHGATKQLKYKRKIACDICHTKRVKCVGCDRDGYKIVDHIEKVKIPAGVDIGLRMKLLGRGHQVFEVPWKLDKLVAPILSPKTIRKYKYGNLIVEFEVLPHPHFFRLGDDLVYEYNVKESTINQASQTIEITHLDGAVLKIEIPQGVSHGKILRIKGKGFKNIKDKTVGHLMIRVQLEV